MKTYVSVFIISTAPKRHFLLTAFPNLNADRRFFTK